MVGIGMVRAAVLVIAVAALGACGGPNVDEQPLPEPTASESSPAPEASEDISATESADPEVELDTAALEDHENPERLLRFYAEAIRARAWKQAARAWSSDAQVTPERLAQVYAGDAEVSLVIGKGDIETAAGTNFYEAPIVVDFSDTSIPERRGTIVLRRANDVPGASAEQLDWRIERSSVMEPQAPKE